MPGVRRRDFVALLGGAAAWPVAARAQQAGMPVVGWMSGRSIRDSENLLSGFREGLRETGFVEGESVAIEYRWADGRYEQLQEMAADLVRRRIAVLVAVGGDSSALAAKHATSTIPVVFGMGGDPVGSGLVTSFNRPGGNTTGYTLLTNLMEPKRIGLLHELVPSISLVGALINPNFPPAARQLQEIKEATGKINLRLFTANASNDAQLDAAPVSLLQNGVGALLVAADPYFDTRRDRIITFAAQNKLPAMYQFREHALAGGLISYGPRIMESYRQAGVYVGRILHGAKPGDLPVLQPTKFDLVLNMKTANALGLAVPNAIQLLADEVIE